MVADCFTPGVCVPQLLDLMHTLHTRAASIYSSWAEEQHHIEASGKKIEADSQTLWTSCWCPLLQGRPAATHKTIDGQVKNAAAMRAGRLEVIYCLS